MSQPFQFPQVPVFPQPVQNQGNTNNDRWKNDAFINISLPRGDGTMGKVGSIGLKLSRPSDRQIIEYLREDPERVVALLQNAHFDFRMANGSTSAGFVLPQAAPEVPEANQA